MKYKATEMHQIAEVQTTFHWLITFTGGPFKDGEALTKRVTTSELPKGEHTPIEVTTHGYKFPTPGIVNRNGDISLTFFESVSADVIDMFQRALEDIYAADGEEDVTGVQQKAFGELFGTIKMELQDKQDVTKQTYTLHKVLVKSIDPGGSLTDGADSAEYFKPVLGVTYGWFNHKKN